MSTSTTSGRIVEIINEALRKEGGYVNHPDDKGGPTKYGITAKTLGAWLKLGRDATATEVQELDIRTAFLIYESEYVRKPGFSSLPDPLREQLVDFGINSGPSRAIRWLQRVLKVPVTGVLDWETSDRIRQLPIDLVNDALVAARCYMIDQWSDADPRQKGFEEGVESRALSFFVSRH